MFCIMLVTCNKSRTRYLEIPSVLRTGKARRNKKDGDSAGEWRRQDEGRGNIGEEKHRSEPH